MAVRDRFESTATPARRVVVIGGSAGALEPLDHVLSRLPPDLPAAVLAVLHLPPGASNPLPLILGRGGRLPVTVAADGEQLDEGRVYLPAPDLHLLVRHGRVHLGEGPQENGHRPAIDPLFRSAARHYGEGAIGVILSGLRDDGSLGLLAIRRAGGTAVVLDPAACAYPDMARNAIAVAEPDHVVSLEEIPSLLVELAGRPGGRPSDVTSENLLDLGVDKIEGALWASVRALESQASLAQRLAEQADRQGRRHAAQRLRGRAEEAAQQAALVRTVALRPHLGLGVVPGGDAGAAAASGSVPAVPAEAQPPAAEVGAGAAIAPGSESGGSSTTVGRVSSISR